jgi:hypothetical protein
MFHRHEQGTPSADEHKKCEQLILEAPNPTRRRIDLIDPADGNESVGSHDPSVCAQNYTGSSKGMEAHGALHSCLNLHQHHIVVYDIIIMLDDDSMMKKMLKWGFQRVTYNWVDHRDPQNEGKQQKGFWKTFNYTSQDCET